MLQNFVNNWLNQSMTRIHCTYYTYYYLLFFIWGRRGRDRMVVGLTTAYVITYVSPLTLWIRIPLRPGVLDTTLCDKVWLWPATGRGFSPGIPVSAINKFYHHDITEIWMKVALSNIHPCPLTSFTDWQSGLVFQVRCTHFPKGVSVSSVGRNKHTLLR